MIFDKWNSSSVDCLPETGMLFVYVCVCVRTSRVLNEEYRFFSVWMTKRRGFTPVVLLILYFRCVMIQVTVRESELTSTRDAVACQFGFCECSVSRCFGCVVILFALYVVVKIRIASVDLTPLQIISNWWSRPFDNRISKLAYSFFASNLMVHCYNSAATDEYSVSVPVYKQFTLFIIICWYKTVAQFQLVHLFAAGVTVYIMLCDWRGYLLRIFVHTSVVHTFC